MTTWKSLIESRTSNDPKTYQDVSIHIELNCREALYEDHVLAMFHPMTRFDCRETAFLPTIEALIEQYEELFLYQRTDTRWWYMADAFPEEIDTQYVAHYQKTGKNDFRVKVLAVS